MAENRMVPLEEAINEVRVTVQRLALLHIAFSNTLTNEFGKERGRQLILNAIKEYGIMIADRTKKGMQSLPKYGFHQRHEKEKTYGCELALLCIDYGQEELGKLYCYVDPAKAMGTDPNTKIIHTNCLLTGDKYCSFDEKPTTEKERNDFFGENEDWSHVDPLLVNKKKGLGKEK